MRSIRAQLLILVCGSVIAVFGILAGMVMVNYRGLVESTAKREMVLITDTCSAELDHMFSTVERACAGMTDYLSLKPDYELLKTDKEYADSFYADLAMRGAKSAEIVGDVNSVYFRPDPAVYGSDAGMLMEDNGYGEFMRGTNTDILAYLESDREAVAWYYEPVSAGRAVWLEPYYNKNMNVYMISYVIPVFVNGKFFGVFGMDIAMSSILRVIDSIDYGDGFAFLVGKEGDILYHKDYPEGVKEIMLDEELESAVDFLISKRSGDYSVGRYKYKGKVCRLMGADLSNDMKLAVSIPNSQVRGPIYRMWRNMLIVLVLIIAALVVMTWFIFSRIVGPIQELTVAASRISKGELNTPIAYTSKNEIGDLAKSIRLMARELNEYFSYIHAQAFTDAMTGVGNKAAYIDAIKRIDRKIIEHMADFGVVVFDINGLKRINDNMGHEFGDMLISDAASVMKVVFGSEKVFRVGGDEFTVIVEGVEASDMELYFEKFNGKLEEFNSGYRKYDAKLSISKGYAIYDRSIDGEFQSVFKRADEAMYEDKERFYKGSNDRRRGR